MQQVGETPAALPGAVGIVDIVLSYGAELQTARELGEQLLQAGTRDASDPMLRLERA